MRPFTVTQTNHGFVINFEGGAAFLPPVASDELKTSGDALVQAMARASDAIEQHAERLQPNALRDETRTIVTKQLVPAWRSVQKVLAAEKQAIHQAERNMLPPDPTPTQAIQWSEIRSHVRGLSAIDAFRFLSESPVEVMDAVMAPDAKIMLGSIANEPELWGRLSERYLSLSQARRVRQGWTRLKPVTLNDPAPIELDEAEIGRRTEAAIQTHKARRTDVANAERFLSNTVLAIAVAISAPPEEALAIIANG